MRGGRTQILLRRNCLNLFLKTSRDEDDRISLGILFHVWTPWYEIQDWVRSIRLCGRWKVPFGRLLNSEFNGGCSTSFPAFQRTFDALRSLQRAIGKIVSFFEITFFEIHYPNGFSLSSFYFCQVSFCCITPGI